MVLPVVAVLLAVMAWLKPWKSWQTPPQPPVVQPVLREPSPAPPMPPVAAKPAPVPVKKTTPTPAKPAPATRTTKEPPRLATLDELPDNIRREIPSVKTNGYIYSRNKAERSVLIGQKLLQEGDQVAPDLTLEKMTPDGMVLNYKGHRYRTPY